MVYQNAKVKKNHQVSDRVARAFILNHRSSTFFLKIDDTTRMKYNVKNLPYNTKDRRGSIFERITVALQRSLLSTQHFFPTMQSYFAMSTIYYH